MGGLRTFATACTNELEGRLFDVTLGPMKTNKPPSRCFANAPNFRRLL
jgi:hypothetical protein